MPCRPPAFPQNIAIKIVGFSYENGTEVHHALPVQLRQDCEGKSRADGLGDGPFDTLKGPLDLSLEVLARPTMAILGQPVLVGLWGIKIMFELPDVVLLPFQNRQG